MISLLWSLKCFLYCVWVGGRLSEVYQVRVISICKWTEMVVKPSLLWCVLVWSFSRVLHRLTIQLLSVHKKLVWNLTPPPPPPPLPPGEWTVEGHPRGRAKAARGLSGVKRNNAKSKNTHNKINLLNWQKCWTVALTKSKFGLPSLNTGLLGHVCIYPGHMQTHMTCLHIQQATHVTANQMNRWAQSLTSCREMLAGVITLLLEETKKCAGWRKRGERVTDRDCVLILQAS